MVFFGVFPDMFEVMREQEVQRPASKQSLPENVFVVSIGGSVIIDAKPNTAMIAKISQSINMLFNEGYRFVLVVGGGRVCRSYVSAAKTLGANNFFQDRIGIGVTRLNASLVIHSLENSFPIVLKNIAKAKQVIDSGKIPVYGGLHAGFTTDAVAALLAESINGVFVNLSNVDGVYSSDPKENPHAKFYPELSYDRLVSIAQLHGSKPGQNVVIDLPASLILKRSKIKAFFLNGNDLENFETAIRGNTFKGTIVQEAGTVQ